MNTLLCFVWWFGLGGFLGWLLSWLFDQAYRRDGVAAGERTQRLLDAANLKMTSMSSDLESTRNTVRHQTGELAAFRGDYADSTRRLSTETASSAQLWQDLTAVHVAHDGTQGELSRWRSAHDAAASERDAGRQQISQSLDEVRRLGAEVEARDRTLASRSEEIGRLRGELEARGRAEKAQIAELEGLRQQLESGKALNASLAAEAERQKFALAKVESGSETMRLEMAPVRTDLAALHTRASTHADDLAKLRAGLSAELAESRKSAAAQAQDIERLRKELGEAQAATRAKLNTLQDLVNAMASPGAARESKTQVMALTSGAETAAPVAARSPTAARPIDMAAASALGFTPRKKDRDNLETIEGIGPRIAELLAAKDIDSFATLAATPVARLQTILDEAGPSFRTANPNSWPRQAALCASGSWQALKTLQDELTAGVGVGSETDAAATALGFAPRRGSADNLEVIEGIGPKINELLKAKGIDSFAKLAESPVDRLRSLLDAGGPNFRMADPASWSQQAGLCVLGAWSQLRRLQDQLSAGIKRPGKGR